MGRRAEQLADRIEEGATTLANFAKSLSDTEWRATVPRDGRTVGVIVHHVGTMYPIEMDVVNTVAQGKAVTDVTWEVVAKINAKHASEHANVTQKEALDLLQKNSREAAAGVRKMSDEELDRSAPFSLSFGAPMTAQFVVEDHPLRHPWHHLARIRAALGK